MDQYSRTRMYKRLEMIMWATVFIAASWKLAEMSLTSSNFWFMFASVMTGLAGLVMLVAYLMTRFGN